MLIKQRDRLEKFLGGIEDMPRIPDVLFIVILVKNVSLLRKLKVEHSIVMVDTNADPDEIDVKIPSNDDAIRAVRFNHF